MKTLKREEIYANQYTDLDHLRANIQEFIEQYYNRQRLHSALGYLPPEEFEQAANAELRRSEDEFFQACGDLSIRCTEGADRSQTPGPSSR